MRAFKYHARKLKSKTLPQGAHCLLRFTISEREDYSTYVLNKGAHWVVRSPMEKNAMAKSTYSVTVIREGREKDYRDFWDHGIKINSKGEELHSDLVGFTEIVEAKNLNEAISIVREMHKGLTIARDHSSKIG